MIEGIPQTRRKSEWKRQTIEEENLTWIEE